MSHRIYIYNAIEPSEQNDSDIMMVEWGYEIPFLLQSLLVDGGFVAPNIYNIYNEANNSGLYYNAKPGIQNLKNFYTFIEKHQAELIDDTDRFLQAKEKLFNFLDTLKAPYFHVDAWDVFNMDDKPHESQAQQMLIDLKQNNDVMANAIAADDVSMLDIKLFTKEGTLGFNNFKELLNCDVYDFGWGQIYEKDEADSEVIIFEENGLWGMKSENGEVLIAPFYDSIYEFDYRTNRAIVEKDHKYGFVNKNGKVVIPVIYNDAYDFDGDYAIVKKEDKEGLVDLFGFVKLSFLYDELLSLAPNEFYGAKRNNKFGVINCEGTVILPFEFDFRFHCKDYSRPYILFVEETGKEGNRIYTSEFNFLGYFDPDFLDSYTITGVGGEAGFYVIRKHNYQNTNVLLSAKSEILVDDFEEIAGVYSEELLIKKNNKYGLFKSKNGLVLNFEYDALTNPPYTTYINVQQFFPLATVGEHEHQTFFTAVKGKLCGLFYSVGNFETWALPVIYDQIKPLNDAFFAVLTNHKWAVVTVVGDLISDFEYDEIITMVTYPGIAYGIIDEKVYTITKDEIALANKNHLQEYLMFNFNTDYFCFNPDTHQKIQRYINGD